MSSRSKKEYLEHLEDQIHFLRDSCDSFDKGNIREYRRISIALRILLHDTKRQTSLFTHLGLKEKLEFFNTATKFVKPMPGFSTSNSGLTNKRFGSNGLDFIPKAWDDLGIVDPTFSGIIISDFSSISYDHIPDETLESAERRIENYKNLGQISNVNSFEEWWTEPLMIGNLGDILTRELAVTSVADTDGGAHVDSKLGPKYTQLSRDDTYGWRLLGMDSHDQSLYGSPFPSTIRQIGYEIVKTYENNLDLINNSVRDDLI